MKTIGMKKKQREFVAIDSEEEEEEFEDTKCTEVIPQKHHSGEMIFKQRN